MEEALKFDLSEEEYAVNEENSPFKIESMDTVNWVFRKIRQLNKQKLENKIIADKERHRIDNELAVINDWESKKNEPIDDSISYFEFLLKQYLTQLRITNPKAKIDTPFGSVNTKKVAAKYEYTEEFAIKWFKENNLPNLIRTKEELNKQDLKTYKRFKEFESQLMDSETGELVPGIKITHPDDEIIVKVVDSI